MRTVGLRQCLLWREKETEVQKEEVMRETRMQRDEPGELKRERGDSTPHLQGVRKIKPERQPLLPG